MEEIIKKLLLAAQDEDTAQGLKKFGIEPDQIEGLKDLKIPATLDEALTIKAVQSDFDKKVAKAIETRENNLKEKFDFVPKEQKPNTPPTTDNPELAALLAKFTAMEQRLEKQEQEKQQLTLQQKKDKAIQLLKEKNIPEVYGSMFDFEKDLEEQLTVVTEKYTADFGAAPKPPQGQRLPFPKTPGNANGPSKEEIEAFKRKI